MARKPPFHRHKVALQRDVHRSGELHGPGQLAPAGLRSNSSADGDAWKTASGTTRLPVCN
jgi:hypothetical protein